MKPSSPVIDLRQVIGLVEAGRLTEAEAMARAALKLAPKNALVHALLGQIADSRGQLDDAVRHYQKSIKLSPRQVMTHIALGQARTGQGRYRDAVASLERALKIEPDKPETVAALADTRDKQGESERALELIQPFLDRGDETPLMAIVAATVRMNRGEHEEAVRVARAGLERHEFKPHDRQLLGFTLGRSLEALGRHDEAFEAYRLANEAVESRFDAVAFRKSTDDLIDLFSSDRIGRLARSTNTSAVPVFIAGMPRSGTTLAERIINAHPEAIAAGEIVVLFNIVADLPTALRSDQAYPKCLLDMTVEDASRLSRRYLEGIRPFSRGVQRVTDKHLHNWRHLGLVAQMFPRARIIHCRRDPVETCFSCFTAALSIQSNPWAGDLESIGIVFGEYRRLMNHWRSVLDVPILDVSYEELIADQEAQSRRLIEFLDLEWDDRCLRFHEPGSLAKNAQLAPTLSYNQVRKPVYQTSRNRAERFADHLSGLRKALSTES